MREFSRYDARGYETASVVDGYNEWARTYDDESVTRLDRALLERLDVQWSGRSVLDLACGTGRIGSHLAERKVACIDGIDLTPGMLERAKARKIYRHLACADLTDTRLSSTYDVVILV